MILEGYKDTLLLERLLWDQRQPSSKEDCSYGMSKLSCR